MSTTVGLLKLVEDLDSKSMAVAQKPLHPLLAAMVESGLLMSSRLRSGPLALLTGEVRLQVTEMGRKLLS
jgi:hypothetical protein